MCKDTKYSSKYTQQKQQWSKALSQFMAEGLRKTNPNSPLKKGYMNTYNCNSVKQYNGEKMKGSYCKNRWCYTCNRIRIAVNINNYGKQISEFGQPYFITLTRPTVDIEQLPNQIERMEKEWRLLYKYSKMKKKQPFKDGIFLKGIRTCEVTLRPNGKYHYHFHVIVDGWANAEWIRSQWLKRNPESIEASQDVRPADAGSLLELFKYAVKMSIKMSESNDFARMDAVYQTLKGKKMLNAFGGIKVLKKNDEDAEFDNLTSQVDNDLKLRLGNHESVWKWQKEIFDWIDVDTGEMLVGKELPLRIKKFVKAE